MALDLYYLNYSNSKYEKDNKMRNAVRIPLLLAAIFFSAIAVKAQNTFTVNEVRQFMSKGEQNGMEIILAGSTP
ncbi:MAG TPA: hypothetical protein PLU78_06930, partial [Chitinophagales bacterium]|nr:hypothetical protein [Chitinophagales bacterium]